MLKAHNITVADNGQLAVDLFQQEKFDLILMDIQMPIMDGYEATRQIRELEQTEQPIPIIALTANAQDSDREQCLSVGMNDFISKPFSKTQILRTVEKWINSIP